MININLQLQQRKYEITKKVKENNLKEEMKIMSKANPTKQKAQPQKERAVKTLKTQRKLRDNWKTNATLRTINLELETKLHSSNRHLNNKNSNNGHQKVKTKGKNIMEKENSKQNITKSYSIYVVDILLQRIKNNTFQKNCMRKKTYRA